MSEDNFYFDGQQTSEEGRAQSAPEGTDAPKVSLEKPQQELYKEMEPCQQGEYRQENAQRQNQPGGQWQNQPGGQGAQWQNQSGPYHGYGQAAYQPPSEGFGIASMIIGILSLVFFCSCINIPLAIISIVFGIVQLSKQGTKRWMSVTGIITSVASIVLYIIFMISFVMSPSFQNAFWDSFESNLEQSIEDNYDNDYYSDFFDSDDNDTF